MTRATILACLTLGLGACGASNELEGSLHEVYDLEHIEVRARLYPADLAIEYVDIHGAVPLRVSIRRSANLESGGTYNLLEQGDLTGENSDGVTVLRLSSGSVGLGAYREEDDATVSGSFTAEFPTEKRAFSIKGNFEAPLRIINWPGPPPPEPPAEEEEEPDMPTDGNGGSGGSPPGGGTGMGGSPPGSGMGGTPPGGST